MYPKVAVDFPRDLKKKLQLTYPELPEGEFDESLLASGPRLLWHADGKNVGARIWGELASRTNTVGS